MRGERLQGVCRLCIVVGQQQITYAVVQRIVQAALALEGVSLAQRTILKQQSYNLVMAAQAGL